MEITKITVAIDEFYVDLKGLGERLIWTEKVSVYHL